jgi:hypothetical protein
LILAHEEDSLQYGEIIIPSIPYLFAYCTTQRPMMEQAKKETTTHIQTKIKTTQGSLCHLDNTNSVSTAAPAIRKNEYT